MPKRYVFLLEALHTEREFQADASVAINERSPAVLRRKKITTVSHPSLGEVESDNVER